MIETVGILIGRTIIHAGQFNLEDGFEPGTLDSGSLEKLLSNTVNPHRSELGCGIENYKEILTAVLQQCPRSPDLIAIACYGPFEKRATKDNELGFSGKIVSGIGVRPLKQEDLSLVTRRALMEKYGEAAGETTVYLTTDAIALASGEHLKRSLDSSEQLVLNDNLVYGLFTFGVGGANVNRRGTQGSMYHPEMGSLPVTPYSSEAPEPDFSRYVCLEEKTSIGAIIQRFGMSWAEISNKGVENKEWDIISYYIAQFCLAVSLTHNPKVIVLGGTTFDHLHGLLQKVRLSFNMLVEHSCRTNNLPAKDRILDENYIQAASGDPLGIFGVVSSAFAEGYSKRGTKNGL